MLRRLPIAFAQVKTSNAVENLVIEVRPIIHYSYWAKELTKKVYHNIMNSIKL